MIHIWLSSPQAPLKVWQHNTQQWEIAEDWQAVATLVSLQGNSKLAKNKQVCLYFPSMYLLKIQPNLPPSQLKTLGDMGKRYLFEEISIAPVDDLQIKTEPMSDFPALYGLHMIDHDQWLQVADLAGLKIVALLPDFLLLPTEILLTNEPQKTTSSAIFYQDKTTQLFSYPPTTIKSSNQSGLAITHLPLFLAKQNQLENLWLSGEIDPTLQQDLAQLTNILCQPTDALPRPVKDANRHWLNFVFIKKSNNVSGYAKVIMMVCIVTIIINMTVDGLRWHYYQKAAKQTQELISQQYQQWFPNEKFNPQLNLQRQLQGKLVNQQLQDNTLMSILSGVQPVLQRHQVMAKQLNYQNKSLQLQIVAKDNESLNKAVSQLNDQGIHAKLGSVNPDADGVISSLQISL